MKNGNQLLTTLLLITISVLFYSERSSAQYQQSVEEGSQNILMQSSEFSIPVSPAFDLLGVNPCLVPKPSLIRNFKVDWSFKSYGLTPNLAIQAQPINEFYFNTPQKLKDYHRKSRILKLLSTVDISIGTVDGNNNLETKQLTFKDVEGKDSIINIENNWRIRSFAFAIKLNVFRENDPLNEKKLFTRILKEYDERKADLKRQLIEQRSKIKETKDFEEKIAIREEVKSIELEINSIDDVYLDRMRKLADLYKAEQWNSSYVDIAFGQSYDYDSRDSSLFKFKDLHMVNSKWALWINGSKGFGKNILTSGIIRISNSHSKLINSNTLSVDVGANVRYGNHRYNFFVEGFVPLNIRNQELVNNLYIAFGGDWRFSRNVILNYGLRTTLNNEYRVADIIPVVSGSAPY